MFVSREKSYTAWRKLVLGCTDPKHPWYPRYGGAGATIFSAWEKNYRRFIEDVGPPDEGKTRIDRIDETKPFEPGNCRWAFPVMGCRPGSQKPRGRKPGSRDWCEMSKSTIYLEKTLVAKILLEAARLGELQSRRISVPMLIRETIEKTFGGAE